MKVLFVCTANSCRSQMAEAWAGALFPTDWSASSAGLITYRITGRTRTAMAEVELAMSGQRSKTIDQFELDDFDLIVTLSEEAGRYLPTLVNQEAHVHVPVEDPMAASGDDEYLAEVFRVGREQIREIVQRIAVGEVGSRPQH